MSRQPFAYALLRAVPRVDRGEAVNVGVLLFCKPLRYLGCRTALAPERLLALDPSASVDDVASALRAVERACDGSAGGVSDDIGKRFHWLTAPRSTVVQAGPVHTGVTADPDAELDRILHRLVLPPG